MSELAFTFPPDLVEAIAQRAAEIVLEQLDSVHHGGTEESPYMTIPETAAYMRCKRSRVDNLLSDGRLTRHKDGARTLVERAEVDRHLAGELVGPVALRLPPDARRHAA